MHSIKLTEWVSDLFELYRMVDGILKCIDNAMLFLIKLCWLAVDQVFCSGVNFDDVLEFMMISDPSSLRNLVCFGTLIKVTSDYSGALRQKLDEVVRRQKYIAQCLLSLSHLVIRQRSA